MRLLWGELASGTWVTGPSRALHLLFCFVVFPIPKIVGSGLVCHFCVMTVTNTPCGDTFQVNFQSFVSRGFLRIYACWDFDSHLLALSISELPMILSCYYFLKGSLEVGTIQQWAKRAAVSLEHLRVTILFRLKYWSEETTFWVGEIFFRHVTCYFLCLYITHEVMSIHHCARKHDVLSVSHFRLCFRFTVHGTFLLNCFIQLVL